jgi:23S rRNA pseudouridine955/2504/2580 synthase
MQTIRISETEEDQRLDRYLKKYLSAAPLSFIYKAIRRDVKVNGARADAGAMLRAGDELVLYLSDAEIAALSRKAARAKPRRQFKVVFEDENVLAVGKPYGLLTHGDGREKKNTLANQVQGYLEISGSYGPAEARTFTPAPVNRLDRNTTGLVLFGKNPKALRDLAAMLRSPGDVEKTYLTIVKGRLEGPLALSGRLVKDEEKNRVRILPSEAETGRHIETVVTPVKQLGAYTLAEVDLKTGRPHQIRAHLAAAGYPVVGDAKYGDGGVNRYFREQFGLQAQLLHAYRIRIIRGQGSLAYLTGAAFESEYPENLRTIEEALGKGSRSKRNR